MCVHVIVRTVASVDVTGAMGSKQVAGPIFLSLLMGQCNDHSAICIGVRSGLSANHFSFPSFSPPAAGRAGMSRRMVIILGNVIRTHLIHDGQIVRKPITRQKYGRGKEGKNLQSRAGMTSSTKEQCRRPFLLHAHPSHTLVLLPVLCLTRPAPAPPPHPFPPEEQTQVFVQCQIASQKQERT